MSCRYVITNLLHVHCKSDIIAVCKQTPAFGVYSASLPPLSLRSASLPPASVSIQVGFQKILTLTYVDKFIDDVQLHFRDRYKNELEQKGALKHLNHSYEFEDDFKMLLR